MPDFRPKRDWYDGSEHICDGAFVLLGERYIMPVDETPNQVREIMDSTDPDDLITLHHHADPEVEVYARNREINAVNAKWTKVEGD